MEHGELLKVEGLKKYFPVSRSIFHTLSRERSFIKAVDGVSFSVKPRETFGIVGESGCGKTTLGLTILKVYTPTEGRIIFDGLDITHKLHKRDIRRLRRNMQSIFQDPYTSLDPRMRVMGVKERKLFFRLPTSLFPMTSTLLDA